MVGADQHPPVQERSVVIPYKLRDNG